MAVYNGVNPNYPGLRVLNRTPPIYCVDNFLSRFECEFLIRVAQDSLVPAGVIGEGDGEISPVRTSSTSFFAREDLPGYMRKVSLLTGRPINNFELPQVGRYLTSQQYMEVSNHDEIRYYFKIISYCKSILTHSIWVMNMREELLRMVVSV